VEPPFLAAQSLIYATLTFIISEKVRVTPSARLVFMTGLTGEVLVPTEEDVESFEFFIAYFVGTGTRVSRLAGFALALQVSSGCR